jgi:hypothetical protein
MTGRGDSRLADLVFRKCICVIEEHLHHDLPSVLVLDQREVIREGGSKAIVLHLNNRNIARNLD